MKILLADDDAVARTLFSHWLQSWGYQVTTVTDGKSALTALESDPEIKLAVLDWMMPELSGVDVVQAVRGRPSDGYVYVILVTARHESADVIEGLDAGADDYIAKPCNPLELRVRLRAGRRMVELQEELVRARETLRYEAMRDPLTGLLNRRAALAALDQELARHARTKEPLSVLVLDLDHFKSVNDCYGHATGDSVLVAAADCLTRSVRVYDHVGRIGGEEFLVVLPGCTNQNALWVAERIRSALPEATVDVPDGRLAVRASIGVAGWGDFEPCDGRTLIAAADRALYESKRLGRDRVTLARADSTIPLELVHALTA